MDTVMSSLESNLDDVVDGINDLVKGWSFEVAGEDRSLGRDLAAEAAMLIQERSIPEAKDPYGSTWAPNEPKYAKRKEAKYDAIQPNVRTGQMLSLQSLLGETKVNAEEVLMYYGTGDPPTEAANGTELTTSDLGITDIEKAFFCSPTRPFYALDDEIKASLVETAGKSLDRYLEEN